ncbi:hypothetical protein OSB04_013795 [Centaurea solstitialis]|uniref:Importin subunit alpha n=1 Tax=Centaurea solstitialis TaxID=347529 RepID=A0AA38TPJ2_9ASTR|nr:hypothetical protein OSB04_013795 [Centaurea solstitialis]
MSLTPKERTEVRRNRYKVAVDAEEERWRREENTVEIRKNKREENLLKKRQILSLSIQTSTIEIKLENLPSMVARLYSNDNNMQMEATSQFRKLLSIGRGERTPPIDQVIQSGVIPRFVEFLMREEFPELQFEAAWALAKIASGTTENTKVIVDHGVVPICINLLASPSDDVREKAVWALGNVAGDSPGYRGVVLGHGALMPLLFQLKEDAKLSMLRIATWALSNFCQGEPRLSFEQMRPTLSALTFLVKLNDEEVLTNSCWALSYLSRGTNTRVQAVIDAGICKRLVELLTHPSHSVSEPALLTLHNIATGDHVQIQHIIGHGLLPCLLSLLTNNHERSLQKEACWVISSIIIVGNKEQKLAMIDAGLMVALIRLLETDDFDILEEVVWVIVMATFRRFNELIRYLVNQGCIKPLCDLLVYSYGPTLVCLCLHGLTNILEAGEAEKNAGNTSGVNLYVDLIVDAKGLEKIEKLQSHDDDKVSERAVKILETYWMLEEDNGTIEDVV